MLAIFFSRCSFAVSLRAAVRRRCSGLFSRLPKQQFLSTQRLSPPGEDGKGKIVPDTPYTGCSITFLGTSAGSATMHRSPSSIAVRMGASTVWYLQLMSSGEDCMLFDCGEGTQRQILFNPHIRKGRIKSIFITHLHGDHVRY